MSVGRALYLGPAGDTTAHAHHAVQVAIALDMPFRLRHGGEEFREWEGVVVAPDVPHQLDGGWGDLVLFYAEPESPDGRRWLGTHGDPVRPLSASTISAARNAAKRVAIQAASPASFQVVYAELMESVGLAPELAATTDRRVVRAVRDLRKNLGRRTAMSELAAAVGLSPSRFRHVFRREVGMSAQSYIVWLRINEACAALARGESLSDAAYQGGFSDAAHFTRTFRRTFGLAPSQLAGRLTSMESSVGTESLRRWGSSARVAPTVIEEPSGGDFDEMESAD